MNPTSVPAKATKVYCSRKVCVLIYTSHARLFIFLVYIAIEEVLQLKMQFQVTFAMMQTL
jgi:hypothetical protein